MIPCSMDGVYISSAVLRERKNQLLVVVRKVRFGGPNGSEVLSVIQF